MKKKGPAFKPKGLGRKPNIFLFLATLLISSAIGLQAQDLGSIVGTVTDPSGAAVPGVTITVTNQLRGSIVRVDFKLSVGAVTQQITVTAPTIHLQTENGSVSQAITGAHVAQIDTDGRNFVQLATLVPGMAGASLVGSLNVPVGVTANVGLNSNGERQAHNVFTVDGQQNYDRGCGGCMEVIPDQDALQEFRVLSSSAGTDVGFGSGAHIQLELKSGTSHFHGEAFEFNRNTALDAGDFFNNSVNI